MVKTKVREETEKKVGELEGLVCILKLISG
jgi:hypothetical protein